MNFTLIAIGSAFFGALANLLARTLLKNTKSQDIFWFNFVIMGITLALLSPMFYFFKATPTSMAVLVGVALIDTLANIAYFRSFEKLEAGIASPVLSLAPAVTFILGFLVLNETVPLRTMLISLGIIFAVVIISLNRKDLKNLKSSGLKYALFASLLFGISAIPSKYLLVTMGAINAPTLYMFRAGYIASFSLLFFKPKIPNIEISQFRILFVRSVFVIIQWLLLYEALTLGSTGVSVTLANVTPVFTFILAAIFLRERITLKKILASALIVGFFFLI
jgi:drug/metabolite transporter (DMT)-like permease